MVVRVVQVRELKVVPVVLGSQVVRNTSGYPIIRGLLL